MAVADELRFLWKLVWDPGKHAKRRFELGGSLKLYYTLAVFAFIAYAIVGTAFVALGLGGASSGFLSVLQSLATSVALLIVIGGGILLFFAAIPLSLLVDALLYQIVAKFFLELWDGEYEKTFAALVFSTFPVLLLYWLTLVPIVNSLFIVVAPIWSLVIFTIALSAQQKIRRIDAMLVLLLKSFLIIVVFMLVGVSLLSAVAYIVSSVTHAGIMSFPWQSLHYPWWNSTGGGPVK